MVAVGFLFTFRALKPFPLPDHRRLLLISVLVLTALLFIDYFFIHEYLPTHIPAPTPISITGLFIVISLSVVFYVVFRKILKQNSELSIVYLMVFGSLITLFSEVIFQFYRLLIMEDVTSEERMSYFLKGVIGIPVYSLVISLTIALDAKYKNRWLNTLVIVGFLVIFYYAGPYILTIIRS